MSEIESRLAALCAAAGYPAQLRELIAQATFPQHRAGGALAEEKLGQLAEAVKLLAQAGLDAKHVRGLIATCRTRDRDRWRELFWRTTVAIAARRPSPATVSRRRCLSTARARGPAG